MKIKSFRIMSIFLSVIMVLNVGIFGLSFGDTGKTYIVGNRVWYDKNSNGVQDYGETGISGVEVKLYSYNGDFIESKTTSSSGYYHFLVKNGDYIIKFQDSTYPSGYFETKRKVGNNDSIDSDSCWKRFEIINDHNFDIDLGLTDKPFQVRVNDYAEVEKLEGPDYTVGFLPRNKIVTVYGTIVHPIMGQSYKILYNGKYRYIEIAYTEFDLLKQLNFTVRSSSTVNIYKGGPNNQLVIGVLPKNTTKIVYGEPRNNFGEKYYHIVHNGRAGFIKASKVKKQQYYVRLTDRVRVREYPEGPVLGYLSKNYIKSAFGYRNDSTGLVWYKIWYNTGSGYIEKLATSRDLTSVPNFNVRLNYDLTVRSSVWGTALGTIPSNTVKTVYGQRLDRGGETWYRVWYNGGPGYIRAKYTTKQ